MNIAFVTIFDSLDISRGSGTYYFMSREMERQGHTVHRIGPLDFEYPLTSRVIRRLHHKWHRRYAAFLDPFVASRTGKQVARKLAAVSCDLVITNDAAVAAYTPAHQPLILYTDVMITHHYDERHIPQARLANLSPLSLWLCRRTLSRALKEADLCIFPAQWIADEARHYNRAVDGKMRVIPFGANVADPGPSLAAGRRLDTAATEKRFDLLLVGKDWARKGGNIAVAVTDELRRRGIQATLHYVGGMPPVPVDAEVVQSYGHLDKANNEQREQLYHLYRTCDAFILPSRSEGFVIVALEAAAFGLPVLAYETAGVTDAVKHQQSGLLFTPGAPAAEFADAVEGWFQNPAEYKALAAGARAHYEQSVNWESAIHSLFTEIEAWLGQQPDGIRR